MTEQAPCRDAAELIRALREDEAHAIDPIGFHYLETLARQAQGHQGHVGQLLQEKLMAATQAFMERARVQREPALPGETPTVQSSSGLGSGLRSIVELMNSQGSSRDAKAPTDNVLSRPELKSVQQFRKTWSKLSMDKQVVHAFAQAPKNAGPLNSHVVALRTLEQMRNISSNYLHRFLSYVDTLARLDQSGVASMVSKKPSPKVDPAKKKRAVK